MQQPRDNATTDGKRAMIRQRTLKNVIQAMGIGLHTGVKIVLTLRPAPANTGIQFRRVDLTPTVTMPAHANFVGDTCLATTLIRHGQKVATIEHLMAAFAGLGIDNVIVDLDGPEVPIMDGSAAPFVFLIQSAGIREQEAPKRFIRIRKPLEVKDGDRFAKLAPFNGFSTQFTAQFPHPLFPPAGQQAQFTFSTMSFIKEISRARTFGFLRDIEGLRAKGLALGGNLDNAIVLDDFRVLNEDGLRYADEFVRHKMLDAVGDLYLLGAMIMGAFTGYKSGHALNVRLVQQLLSQQNAWEWVEAGDSDVEPFADWQPVAA